MKRRDFLKLTGNYAGLLGFSSMGFPLNLWANSADTLTGYKALVVILQHGGNDSLNMFIPSSTDSKRGYSNYAAIRTSLAVKNSDLSAGLTKSNGKLYLNSNPYDDGNIIGAYTKGFYKHSNIDGLATNGVMPEFANLVNEGKVAMVANLGTLVQPTTREEILSNRALLPPYLYSHNNQRKLLFNGLSSKVNHLGWAGLLADEWIGINGDQVYGMNTSLSSETYIFSALKTEPLFFPASGPLEYYNIQRSAYDDWLKIEQRDKYKNLYQRLRIDSFQKQDILNDDWDNNTPIFSSTNAYGGKLFSLPDNRTLSFLSSDRIKDDLLNQLNAVAKLISIGKKRGLKRQIFYVVHSGYDTHSDQPKKHSALLRELSMAIGDFQLAMEELGVEDEVTTFNISDFGRSVGNNGDGTDHAWGAHHFVVGGAVKGGLYGTLPDLTLGGEDDATQKGRLIPTTSISQYYGTLVKWFGADETTLNSLFPERNNFATKDLGFML